MPVVTFLPGFKKIEVPKGESILTAAQKAGLNVNVVCGGIGKCGKCMMFLKSGRADYDSERYKEFFSPDEIEAGACLACKTYVIDDCQVLVPEKALIQSQQILVDVIGQTVELRPPIWKFYLELTPPTLDNPITDLDRLLTGVHESGGPVDSYIYAPLEGLRRIPAILRESAWKVTATITLVPGGYRLINLEKGNTTSKMYGVAVDLGTTTIVAFLRDLTNGKIIGVASNYNKQISCGEDILSRVNYGKRGGFTKLQALAAESINSAVEKAANEGGVDTDDIYQVVVAGNTIMTHILMGIDPSYMIKEPYVPVVRRALSTSASRIGLSVRPNGGVFIFPAVSDFIGGDIIADILASGMTESSDISLMVDIGTNFEIVLGNNDWIFACAGAAGPALEGGEVLFGMRANPGAIEKVTIDPVTLEPTIHTINDQNPKGICGSGLIDILAELLRACVIDRNGKINTAIKHPRIRQGSYYPEYVIVFKDNEKIEKDIVITEKDIKNLIMSKASTLAACTILMNQAGITRNDIKTLYFAGGFGNYINKDNAVTIGLIPEMPIEQIKNLGNGAAEGANMALLDRKKRKLLDKIAEKIGYIELNAEPSFMDEYTQSAFLPHTDLSLFPNVEKALEECRIHAGNHT